MAFTFIGACSGGMLAWYRNEKTSDIINYSAEGALIGAFIDIISFLCKSEPTSVAGAQHEHFHLENMKIFIVKDVNLDFKTPEIEELTLDINTGALTEAITKVVSTATTNAN